MNPKLKQKLFDMILGDFSPAGLIPTVAITLRCEAYDELMVVAPTPVLVVVILSI
jgi:hypothetical protein